MMAKRKNPAAVALGKLGGSKRVPKGLATMSEEKAREVRQAGAKAMWAKKWAAKKVKKVK